jgi:hypothetical protein
MSCARNEHRNGLRNLVQRVTCVDCDRFDSSFPFNDPGGWRGELFLPLETIVKAYHFSTAYIWYPSISKDSSTTSNLSGAPSHCIPTSDGVEGFTEDAR